MSKQPYEPIKLTLRINKGKGKSIPIYYIASEGFLRLDDVIQLVGTLKTKWLKGEERGFACNDDAAKGLAFLALTDLQTKLVKSETDCAKSYYEARDIIMRHNQNGKKSVVPGRYAVGRELAEGKWAFYRHTAEGNELTMKPCQATLYERYKDAEASADFLGEEGWKVLDFWDNMSKDEKLLRSLLCDDNADDGSENAVKIDIIT